MMELRRLSVAAIMGECRKVGKSSRSTVFAGALALTLIGCSVFLAFLTYPSSPIPIPMVMGTEHRQSWRSVFLRDDHHHDETSASSNSGSFLSVLIPPASGSPSTPSSSADLPRNPRSGANAAPDLALNDTTGAGSNRSSHSLSQSQSQSQSRPQNRTENAHAESASAGKGLQLSKNATSKLNSSETGAPPAEQGSGKVEQRGAAAGADLNISSGNSAETEPHDEEKEKKKNKGKNKERGSGELQPVSASSNVSSAAPKQQQNKTSEAVAVEEEQKNKKKEEQKEKKNRNESVVVVPAATTMMKKCDLFDGKWVPDNNGPLYPGGSCPHIDESFNCFRNRRPDDLYQRWRWQPHDCTIPRLNATDMLERMRNKRLMFVGDSLNRNMWESLVCILRDSVSNKTRVYEISGKKQFRTEGFYAFHYEDYNCSVEFVRAPFLVQEWEVDGGNGTKKETLRLDLIESSFPKVKEADIVIFNTGHWWTHEKTSKGQDYYQEGDHVYPELNVLEAYRKALKTWANWVEANIDFNKTTAFFRGYSATHFSGGQWNSGGQCHKEIEPIYNETYITKYPPKMQVLESVLKEMKNEVLYLNITRMTDYRKDAHPSIYRREYLSQEERIKSERYQDCSHWCLPGVPDIWNEVVYAWLLRTGKGSWRT